MGAGLALFPEVQEPYARALASTLKQWTPTTTSTVSGPDGDTMPHGNGAAILATAPMTDKNSAGDTFTAPDLGLADTVAPHANTLELPLQATPPDILETADPTHAEGNTLRGAIRCGQEPWYHL